MVSPEDLEQFWAWFAEAEQRLDDALRDPDGRVTAVDEIRFRVDKVQLSGDVLHAPDGRHLILGSPAGDPDRRVLAAAWLSGAPESERFAFAMHHPAASIDRLMATKLSGRRGVAIAEMRFAYRWRRTDDRADITAYVPPGLTNHHGDRIATTVLHSALGELDYECWVGAIHLASEPPEGSVDLAGLLGALVPDIQARSEPRWEEYRYEKPGAPPLVVAIRQPLQPPRHPYLDTCVELATELIDDDPAEPERMRGQLLDGMPADVLLTCSVTTGRRMSTLVYANGGSPTLGMLRERASMLGSVAHTTYDPDWRSVRRYQAIDPAAA